MRTYTELQGIIPFAAIETASAIRTDSPCSAARGTPQGRGHRIDSLDSEAAQAADSLERTGASRATFAPARHHVGRGTLEGAHRRSRAPGRFASSLARTLALLLRGWKASVGASLRIPCVLMFVVGLASASSVWAQGVGNGTQSVAIRAVAESVTEGTDAAFRFSRTGSTTKSLSVGVNIHGHTKIMSAATRALAQNVGPQPDTTVTFDVGEREVTLALTTEADRVNEGDGEIRVVIPESSGLEVNGTGPATVLVEDDDIPQVTLRWISPTMTVENDVWVGSMVEGTDIEFEVVCSGDTLAPDGARMRIPLTYKGLLNHPYNPHFNRNVLARFPCADQPAPGFFGSVFEGDRRWVGPANGRIEIDLHPQVLYLDDIRESSQLLNRRCYGSIDDIRFCPKFTLDAVRSARIEVLNRNPTVTVEALSDEVTEGSPARFRLTRIWNADNLKTPEYTTTFDFTTAVVGAYVTSPPSGQRTFGSGVTEIIVEIPTVNDDVGREDGLVTFEVLRGNPDTQSSNVGGHYEVYDHLDGITPPGKNSRVASVKVRDDDGGSSTPQGPSMTVRAEHDAYRFLEGAGTGTVVVIARTSAGIPKPTSILTAAVTSHYIEGSAVPGSDYDAVSSLVFFRPNDFTADGNVWQARKEVALTIVDDAVVEPDEVLDLKLGRGPGAWSRVELRRSDGTTACPARSNCSLTVTIVDNDALPGLPRSLTATAGDRSVELSWQAPRIIEGVPVIDYEIRNAQGMSVPETVEWRSAGTDRTETVSGLVNGTEYTFEVRAVNANGAGEPADIQATPATVPSEPQSLTATPGDEAVTLAWQAPSDDGGLAVTGYQYRHAEGASVPENVEWRSAGTDRTETVSGLVNGTEYTFEVRAVNANGAGEPADTQATPATVPSEPQSLTATPGDEAVTLAWQAPSDDGGLAVTGYQYRHAEGASVPENVEWRSAGTDRTETVSGLVNGTEYTFEVPRFR